MERSRIETPQSPAACSRVFSGRDVLSDVIALQSKRLVRCSSESARSPANQSSCRSVVRLNSKPRRLGGAPRASSVGRTAHQ